MRYEEFRPIEPLARFIKCFWTLEGSLKFSAKPERILPDGCTEMVFHTGDPFDQHRLDGTVDRQPLALMVGQMRGHLLIQPTGRVRVLGVRFWPGGAYPFLAIPQNEIAGRVLALDSMLGATSDELHSKIADAASPAESVKQVETLLLNRLNKFTRRDEAVLNAIALILRSGGSVAMDTLTENLGINLRKLDRGFNTWVGVSPKTLCRIVRFQRVFKVLERHTSEPDWIQLALECGYYDQSHFIKEFRTFAGKSPTAYFAEQNALSDYFMNSQ